MSSWKTEQRLDALMEQADHLIHLAKAIETSPSIGTSYVKRDLALQYRDQAWEIAQVIKDLK